MFKYHFNNDPIMPQVKGELHNKIVKDLKKDSALSVPFTIMYNLLIFSLKSIDLFDVILEVTQLVSKKSIKIMADRGK